MVDDQKLALKQLQKYLLYLIRELEANGEILNIELIKTDDFEFELNFRKKVKLVLVKNKD